MIKASLALMFSHGQRPRKQLGITLRLLNSHRGICLAPLLGLLHCSTVCDENATTLFYDIALVTDTEAEEVVSAADDFLLVVEADIKKRTP